MKDCPAVLADLVEAREPRPLEVAQGRRFVSPLDRPQQVSGLRLGSVLMVIDRTPVGVSDPWARSTLRLTLSFDGRIMIL